MIQAMIEMEFAPDKVEEVLQILRSIIERTRAEAGCVSCSVYQNTEMENQIVFAQEWRREEDLQQSSGMGKLPARFHTKESEEHEEDNPYNHSVRTDLCCDCVCPAGRPAKSGSIAQDR
jgi:quinol monooxygenase YgiN